ncbi:hypothetical protein DCAR_0416946 [Daucus carota subsp. sativus]|uniref:Uncharacterized protein n=1 Tax=Daucus carota subsp. sativus TaxID=79200 RepID=A0AAF1AZ10_DAUCS|nr:PREDICTED: (-)-germacrene D synthase-like [Daucus carota subsp. sativus]WOG97605.1 hypothetical protein DCAR_0416946 [Daucus carota subsp. sativus]
MSVCLQASSSSHPPVKEGVPEIVRRSANYHPCVWGDHFLAYSGPDHAIPDHDTERKIQELKEEVKEMLLSAAPQPNQQLKLIDDLQRLGLAYHFEAEINLALHDMNGIFSELFANKSEDDLRMVALCFRLLRQQGYDVSSDVFKQFKDENKGTFKDCLSKDVEGLLSLYEAAHLRLHGEDILEEALAFTTSQLEQLKGQLKNPLAAQVTHALKIPIWRSVNRAEARRYISVYSEDDSHNEALLLFAKLDFNLLQKLHQGELANIYRWWEKFNFKEKLPFARDRWVECYFWGLGLYFEPQYALARTILTKVFSLMIVLDDIYDVYGTLEEVTLLTDAIDRLDISALDQLPDYMKYFYQILLDFYAEVEEDLSKEGLPLYRVQYAKDAMKQLTRSYQYEAECLDKGLVPTMDEYMHHGLVTAALTILGIHSFLGIRDMVTEKSLDWISHFPLLIRAGCLFCRLTDDMIELEAEKKTVDTASAVECYMKQHGVSKEHTFSEFRKQIVDAWIDINSECLRPTAVPMPLISTAFNMVRVTNLLYQDIDGFTTSETKTKEILTPVLVDSIPI